MDTTSSDTLLPVVTQTDVTNAIEVFMYDVAEANSNQAGFWNSVSHFFNNIIDSVKSVQIYIDYIIEVTDVFIQENTMPVVIGSALSISMFFLWLKWYRGR